MPIMPQSIRRTALTAAIVLACAPLGGRAAAQTAPGCDALARDYDWTLRAIEHETAGKQADRLNARLADRAALLDAMVSKKCPLPTNLRSEGYTLSAQGCALAEMRAKDQGRLVIARGGTVDQAFATAEQKAADAACDVKTWTYKLPE
jgi:hypothetical protein